MMSILNINKELYGVKPVGISDLNRRTTGEYHNKRINHPFLESSSGFKIIPKYKKIHQLLDQGTPVVFVTGNSGTGKTTLVHYLRSVVKRNLVVLAPTGIVDHYGDRYLIQRNRLAACPTPDDNSDIDWLID